MPQWFPSRSPAPSQLDSQWSALIVIVGVLFLVAVFAFYYYVR